MIRLFLADNGRQYAYRHAFIAAVCQVRVEDRRLSGGRPAVGGLRRLNCGDGGDGARRALLMSDFR
jgi:hypothetical protein